MNLNEKLHHYGRKVVLPSEEIMRICRERLDGKVRRIIDFGAGTLYWSKWLTEALNCQVLAVDIRYNRKRHDPFIMQCITLFDDIYMALAEPKCDCVWMCDVIHHLDGSFFESLKANISKHEYIVIKDIDCNHRFGNIMNRLHDRIINGERINDVSQDELQKWLENCGYVCERFYLPKLWYPHFLIIGKKK